jgi:hypothetical protein
VFADTVAAKSHTRQEEGHGWLGIRFQPEPRGEASEIVIHARMWDSENVRQQEALGILGVSLDMLERALEQMRGERPDGVSAPALTGEPVVMMEMTLRNLLTLGERVEHADFLSRMETLQALGKTVMISNYSRFHNVTTYLRRYTGERIGMALGIPTLVQLFEETHYRDLPGGILEAFGRLLAGPVSLYVYPWKNELTGETVTAGTFRLPPRLHNFYAHLAENGYIKPIERYDAANLSILPRDIYAMLQAGDPGWESLVPPEAARVIKARRLFGYRG